MKPPQTIFERIDDDRHRYVDELLDFLRIPSVSTYSRNIADIQKAAHWCLQQLQQLGFHASIFETQGHPVVYAYHCPHSDRPTLLIYGHYDVQPPEPLEEWLTPPFSPAIRDGYVYARGASDDKGQFFTYLKAIESILAADGEIPINVKILLEGEEEIGSPHLGPFLEEHQSELKGDVVAISDGSQFAKGIPAITYGIRGMAYLQIDVEGPRFDLHSGAFGGMVANPAQVLAQILARLKNENGTVAIPGFYDDVLELEEWERQEMASLAFNEAQLKDYLGVNELTGEPGYSLLERKGACPTLDINGIWGGFAGEGAKTIIPAKAGAKVSMRLVPNQTPATIKQLFKDFVFSMKFPGVRIQVEELLEAEPVLISREQESVRAAARAIETGFGKAPVFIREGGSIPVVNLFKRILGLDSILMGWGSSDDGAHSPNERFRLEDFYQGTRSAAAFLYELAG
jgi:acetylornithine deacetylase/succinyl-diaminopimelate desuccinylase-like protein